MKMMNINIFSSKEEKKLNECVDLFDSNEYPIQLIFTKNGGYSSQLSYIVEKMISPYEDTNYITVRISDFTEDRMKIDYSMCVRPTNVN
ncbi:hypothetical protein EDI_322410 [Entamoeba dispar SAW760]|uniref:Uncharacterized protein n=1 Tax=Entamoeba dispar (strain ATCC PRA-260 / SAW760) TaxID=370354 RepID=B0E5S3_ENTDS|nr:uncharacterized protein EDI_322410 [Entamoeba dispar SAW760]EDR30109.1 hypothetical protein EDI_322410 [Entamoeba dispar SAW760]|eukprot:EDR30109.1 hypothetical protein EDI_322410 [Entamoeba dispar SAW760]